MAALLVLGIAAVLFFRNSPQSPAFEQPPVLTTPVPSDAPSKENVHSSYTMQIEQLKRSVEKDPKNAAHLISLAQLLMDGHQNNEAIRYFEQASILQPENDSLLLDLAVCYANNGRSDRAMEVTERLLKKDGRNVRALYNKGALLASSGKQTEAAAVWKRLLTIAPASEEAKTVRGYLAAMEKR